MIQDAMARDLDWALGVAPMFQNYSDVATWAQEYPHLALALAHATDDFPDQAVAFTRAVDTHGKAQRGLAEETGYTRDVWHRPPGAPVE